MNLYVYSDESGVFDKAHNDIFVFGGLVLIGREEKERCTRKYSRAERTLAGSYPNGIELKATTISNTDKGKLFRSLNSFYKFSTVVHQKDVLDSVFGDKKTKQRYLDFAFKRGLKNALENMAALGIINLYDLERLFVCVDEHTTATNGVYELRETIEQELRYGIHNLNYDKFFPPICPNLIEVRLDYCNSATTRLIRSADIIANRIYYDTSHGHDLSGYQNLFVKELP